MKALRFAPALVLGALAVAAALLAADVRGWQNAFAGGTVRESAAPAAATRLPGDPARGLLGVDDDLRFREALRGFVRVVGLRTRLDNAAGVTAQRAHVETQLAALAHGNGARASQAATLLGVLAFGDLSRGGGRDVSQAQTAVADFESAVRADPSDEIAKFDLELALRGLEARGVRTGPNGGSGAGARGRRGAGSGTPGSGY